MRQTIIVVFKRKSQAEPDVDMKEFVQARAERKQVLLLVGIVSLDEEGHTWLGMGESKLTWVGSPAANCVIYIPHHWV